MIGNRTARIGRVQKDPAYIRVRKDPAYIRARKDPAYISVAVGVVLALCAGNGPLLGEAPALRLRESAEKISSSRFWMMIDSRRRDRGAVHNRTASLAHRGRALAAAGGALGASARTAASRCRGR